MEVCAAQYVRMSTEHQQYSIDNQIDAIREFAEQRGLRVVKTYADPGRSGLTLKSRPGLQRLLADVECGAAQFSKLLVYDVSRWGRFQDPDEAAAYEHVCRSHGVHVIYCAETFDNVAGGIANSVVKHIKRSMAAEFSRDLSLRIGRAGRKVARLGYWPGAMPPYGYERWAVAPDGRELRLEPGDYKHVQFWRTTLRPGPPEAVDAIRRMFTLFVDHGRSPTEVARTLNSEGWKSKNACGWIACSIRTMVTNETYGGRLLYNRSSKLLLADRVHNPPDEWVVVDNAFEPIIPLATVTKARERFGGRRPFARTLTDAQMLDGLAALLAREGRLDVKLVEADKSIACVSAYGDRFGSVSEAFALVGYKGNRLPFSLDRRRKIKATRVALVGQVRLALGQFGTQTETVGAFGLATENHRIAVAVVTPASRQRLGDHWDAKLKRYGEYDVVFVARVTRAFDTLDYQLLRMCRIAASHLAVGPHTKSAQTHPSYSCFDDAVAGLATWVS